METFLFSLRDFIDPPHYKTRW